MDDNKEAVVLVHGLWMKGPEMMLLRLRLRQAGFSVHQFSYLTVWRGLAENARRLQAKLSTIEAPAVHFVAHSLGGLVVRQLFYDFPQQRPGRVVTLGTPHRGSQVAEVLARFGVTKPLLGQSRLALQGEAPPWSGTHELGSLAGSLPAGLGRLIDRLPLPNDGTVAVEETELEGMDDHLIMPVSHSSMLFVPEVARQVVHFLRHGRFHHLSDAT